jgi:hypothetical protein
MGSDEVDAAIAMEGGRRVVQMPYSIYGFAPGPYARIAVSFDEQDRVVNKRLVRYTKPTLWLRIRVLLNRVRASMGL